MANPGSRRKSRQRGAAANKLPLHPALDPQRNYSRREAIAAVGISKSTLIRAIRSEELGYYQIGRRVLHSGSHLIDWMKRREHPAKGGSQ